MARFEKTELAQRVSLAVEESIQGRAAGDIMPGLRSVALRLGVSVPTVSRAFSLLEKRGVLETNGERRRWKIAAPPQVKSGRRTIRPITISGKRLLYLTHSPMKHWLSHGVEVYADLLAAMSAQGWELVHRVISFHDAKAAHKSWDDLIQVEKPDAMVVLAGNPVLAGWAVNLPFRTLFLGGVADPHALPMVRVGIAGPVEELGKRLIDLGHRHIVLPLCGRSPEFSKNMKEVLRKCMAAANPGGAEIHTLETPYATPEVLYDAMRRHWRANQPDALMLFDWREFVTATSFFRDSGISIPRDISVALLSSDNSMDWYQPKLAHYEFNTTKLAKAVGAWAANQSRSGGSKARITMRAQWRDGGSISDRR